MGEEAGSPFFNFISGGNNLFVLRFTI